MKKQLIALGALLALTIGSVPSFAACPCQSVAPVQPCCPQKVIIPCCPQKVVVPCCPKEEKKCCPTACPCAVPMPCPAAPVQPCCDPCKTYNDCCD